MAQFPKYADLASKLKPWYWLICASHCGANGLVNVILREKRPGPQVVEAVLLAAFAGMQYQMLERLLSEVDFELTEIFYREIGRILSDDYSEASVIPVQAQRLLAQLLDKQTGLPAKKTVCQHLSRSAGNSVNVFIVNYLAEQITKARSGCRIVTSSF